MTFTEILLTEKGRVVEKSESKTRELMEEAANLGCVRAQLKVATAYHKGEGVPVNKERLYISQF